MLLAKQFEFAQQIIISCSKGSIKIIKSMKLFDFFRLFLNDFLEMGQSIPWPRCVTRRNTTVDSGYMGAMTRGHGDDVVVGRRVSHPLGMRHVAPAAGLHPIPDLCPSGPSFSCR